MAKKIKIWLQTYYQNEFYFVRPKLELHEKYFKIIIIQQLMNDWFLDEWPLNQLFQNKNKSKSHQQKACDHVSNAPNLDHADLRQANMCDTI